MSVEEVEVPPPKPASRPDGAGIWRRLQLFRQDLFSSQPDRLYDAWMAETRTPLYASYLINQPDLAREVLTERPGDFDKTGIIGAALRPLLGNSVFLTNGAVWARQRRIVEAAFEGGRLRSAFPAIQAAAEASAARLAVEAGGGPVEVGAETAHFAADVIFRTLFSVPIEDDRAARVYAAFQAYQRAQPLANLADLLRAPSWIPRWRSRTVRGAARTIRQALVDAVAERQRVLDQGAAPDDLATKLMTTPDPVSGAHLSPAEVVDQIATFFLAGHETSASSLAWTLYLLATHPGAQAQVAEEAQSFAAEPSFGALRRLAFTRDVVREALRLYPPVPVIMRDARRPEHFRRRAVRAGSMIMVAPWYMHRHRRLWRDPDAFDPHRWSEQSSQATAKGAYLPFSAGPRVCPGASFAMLEATLALAVLLARFELAPVKGRRPRPVAHLTVRAADGIWLTLRPRS
ncbi:MAG: cytochrome P450 [Pseudomonadota bacterium]